MMFLTTTAIVESGLWLAIKSRSQKISKSFWVACQAYGERRARNIIANHKLGIRYDV